MVFYLASLPRETFFLIKQIYSKFVSAELKAQQVPRCKKGTVAKPLDLKGSQFKCLRGIDLPDVHRLLDEVKSNTISLKEMSSECMSIKQIQKVQLAFIRGTNTHNWSEACEQFPVYTTAEQLEPFKKLDFSGKTLPPTFLKFCQRALQAAKDVSLPSDQHQDDLFCIHHGDATAIFWKAKVQSVTADKFVSMITRAMPTSSHSFPGFVLSIFDLSGDYKVSC